MSVYATPQLISTLFLLALGVVSLLTGRRERLWKIFAIFCFFLMFGSFFGFLMASGRSAWGREALMSNFGIQFDLVSFHARMSPVFGLLSITVAIFYSVALIGAPVRMRIFGKPIIFDFRDDHFSVNIFGFDVTERFYFIYAVAIIAMISVIFIITPVDIEIKKWGNWPGLNVTYGVLGNFMAFIVLGGVIKIIYFLVYAYRENHDRIYRHFIVLNLIAFTITYASALTFGVLLPVFGIPSHLYASTFFPLAVIIFFIAIVRFQFARAEELNITLERKVEERTAELKDAYARMVQSEKMASLGQLVAGVAHEINNPVGAVLSSQQSLERGLEKLELALGGLECDHKNDPNITKTITVLKNTSHVIGDGSKRVADSVRKLKNFAKLDEAELQTCDIHSGIEESLAIIGLDHSELIAIERDYGNLPKITCNPRQLNQVWMNLFLNASEAINGSKGMVAIRTRNDNGSIEVTIKDSGPGIPEDRLNRIFDPGYTTKSKGTGTGLGLAICYRIIEAHKGEIRVNSQPEHGTTFNVSLPV